MNYWDELFKWFVSEAFMYTLHTSDNNTQAGERVTPDDSHNSWTYLISPGLIQAAALIVLKQPIPLALVEACRYSNRGPLLA